MSVNFTRPKARAVLTPAPISPRRHVPSSIVRPPYVDKPAPPEHEGGYIPTAEQVANMRIAGKIAANALQEVGKAIVPGVTTDELDRIGHEYLLDHGAYPSTLGYRGYPKSLCASLNEVICHGIPSQTVVEDGDIVNIDITAYIHGVHGDTNATFLAGNVAPEVRDLVERTHEATMRGIKAARPGREVNVIGAVIEKYAKRFGYDTVRDYTGHGISTSFHSGLIIPHYDAAPHHNDVIQAGMTFTVEPMLTLGKQDWEEWDDEWTITTRDKSFTAQFEHTVLITDDGFEILTAPDAN